jgi:hypothetical protein
MPTDEIGQTSDSLELEKIHLFGSLPTRIKERHTCPRGKSFLAASPSLEHHCFARIAVSFHKTWILPGQQNPDAENCLQVRR